MINLAAEVHLDEFLYILVSRCHVKFLIINVTKLACSLCIQLWSIRKTDQIHTSHNRIHFLNRLQLLRRKLDDHV